jgi:hypothetical protein
VLRHHVFATGGYYTATIVQACVRSLKVVQEPITAGAPMSAEPPRIPRQVKST